MKKVISLILAALMLTCVLSACSAKSSFTTGDWIFSKVVNVTIKEDLDEAFLAELKEEFNVSTDEELEKAALESFIEEKTFEATYIKFDKDRAYTYDEIMERESTWAYYITGENEGFLSVYTDLNVEDGNPDPITNPVLKYNPETKTLSMDIWHASYIVTVEYVAA